MAINKSEVQQPANVMACDKKTEELYVFFCAYGEYAKFPIPWILFNFTMKNLHRESFLDNLQERVKILRGRKEYA